MIRADYTSGLRRRTSWIRDRTAPLQVFLRTGASSAGVLLVAVVTALIWASADLSSYESLWHTTLLIRLGGVEVSHTVRVWINSGLMTLFFLVVGLEARREVDLGDLRERRQFVLPIAAGSLGLIVPVAVYLAFNAAGPGVHGWGTAMSTDTALAMGLLGLVGRAVPQHMLAFLLTVFVVDDLVALVVIAVAYSGNIRPLSIVIALAAFGVLIAFRRTGLAEPWLLALLGATIWVTLLIGGVDPVVTGLAVGLTVPAYTPDRGQLERASSVFRRFREQPTAELARSATAGLTSALSLNTRLQRRYHSWTSYVIVPLFALANAGIRLNGSFLAHAYFTPITLGIIVGYVVGKPTAIIITSWLVGAITHQRVQPGVGWASLAAGGTIAGIGFTVSLLIAALAFDGPHLAEAKLGVLTTGVIASVLTWAILRIVGALPAERRARALLGRAEGLTDLVTPVDPDRDHIRGAEGASVTVVEYGDFQCPYCGRAEQAVRELLIGPDVRFVWRHLPLGDVHPEAPLAAEAADGQGAFWQLHDLMLTRQRQLRFDDLLRYADELGLDRQRFHDELASHQHAARIAQDIESADLSGASGTPTFFINGRRHYGAYDAAALTAAVQVARQRSVLTASRGARPGHQRRPRRKERKTT